MLKTIAMYLPQFHRVKENDEWWGEGFTEWTAVQSAKPQYDGHNQPVRPLNDEYYDLMDKRTLEWQVELAHKYKIDGFAFYHYFFKNGRKILEKPAENLLKWKDINMPFLFAWDPVQWARSWTNVGNSWAETFEDKQYIKNGVLLEQDFGGSEVWEEHFQYLLPFFKDDRYIKVDNKPVFYCLIPNYIPCFMRMISHWRARATEEGLSGLYIISYQDYSEVADAYLDPMRPEKNEIITNAKYNNLRAYDYDKAWKEYLSCPQIRGVENLYQCIVKYDDTPRRGQNAMIFVDASPEKFKKYLAALRYKSMLNHNKFMFINAWNEWGEGMYLEPDTKDKYMYLEAVHEVLCLTPNELYEYVKKTNLLDYVKKGMVYQENFIEHDRERNKYFLMHNWLSAKLHDEAIRKYLENNAYKNVAIYGFGVYGHMLYEELIKDGVNIPFVIDRKLCKSTSKEKLKILGIDKQLPRCDLIIISTIFDNIEIYEQLKKITSDEIISMQELCKYALENI